MDRGHKIQPADLQKELIDDLAHGDVIVLSSHTNLDTSKPQHHDLSIYGYDSKNDVFQIRDPHNKLYKASLQDLFKDRDAIWVGSIRSPAIAQF